MHWGSGGEDCTKAVGDMLHCGSTLSVVCEGTASRISAHSGIPQPHWPVGIAFQLGTVPSCGRSVLCALLEVHTTHPYPSPF